jgi:hypothetical protein
MSEQLSDKDKMIAFLIGQLNDKQKAFDSLNERLHALELSNANNEKEQINRSITMAQVQEAISNVRDKPLNSETEKMVKKGVELIIEGQRRGLWNL